MECESARAGWSDDRRARRGSPRAEPRRHADIALNATARAKELRARPLPVVTAPIVVGWDPVDDVAAEESSTASRSDQPLQVFIERDGFNLDSSICRRRLGAG